MSILHNPLSSGDCEDIGGLIYWKKGNKGESMSKIMVRYKSPEWSKHKFGDLGPFSIDGTIHSVSSKVTIPYSTDIISCEGVTAVLFVSAEATEKDVENAKSAISYERDVVNFKVYKDWYYR